MEQRRIPVPAQAVDQLQQFDRSITHWSGEHTKLTLQLKSMLENVDGLYQGRQALLDKVLADAGVNAEQVVQLRPVMNDGKLELAVLLKPQAQPAGPSIVMPDGSPAASQKPEPSGPTGPA